MKHYFKLFTWLPLIFFIHSINPTPTHSLTIPRLSPFQEKTLNDIATLVSTDPNDTETFYYKQVLDHFNYNPESYNTFNQRYLINFKYWGGANSSAPIFVYFGPEQPIDGSPKSIGFMVEKAPTFKALLVYIEVLTTFHFTFPFAINISFNIQLSNSNISLNNFYISIGIMENQYHLGQGKKRSRMQTHLDILTRLKPLQIMQK